VSFGARLCLHDLNRQGSRGLGAGIDAELLTSGNTVTINVFEPFKAKPGYTAAVLTSAAAIANS
jgi:hypothetical protein